MRSFNGVIYTGIRCPGSLTASQDQTMADNNLFAKYGPSEPEKDLTVSDLEQLYGDQYIGANPQLETPIPQLDGPENLNEAFTIDDQTTAEAASIFERYGTQQETLGQESPEISIEQDGIDPSTFEMAPEEPSQLEQFANEELATSGFMNDGSLIGELTDRLATGLGADRDMGADIAAGAKAIWEKFGPGEKQQEEQQKEIDEPER